jgi:thiol-disulfide isomerase/thioredoxin
MSGIRSDAELSSFLSQRKQKGGPGVSVVEFGTAWCTKCHEMFPAFYALTKKVRPAH